MSQTEQADVPEPLPNRINKKDDEWYEYDGEPLWNDDLTEAIEERLIQMEEMEWEDIVLNGDSRYGNHLMTKIRTKDVDEFEKTLIERFDEVNDEWDFLLEKEQPDVFEKGPQRTDVSISYSNGGPAMLGGAEWKEEKILKEVRKFERYIYHTKVVQPTMEEYNEKYPY